ncbi:MAG: prepilin-type N-terminal cleavage/methylation domain-containing protein [Thiohalocapsa sp.]|jgi:prepilin-type N-terminal cleavage/methylation domain-containing protein|uniref:type IV pilin protein n=1 Tax=Thiohalocapsa sp. TaxID=2497641 RepID=UPI0025EC8168|nr:prepilin-type N-terminal cleavage/methylation domain-containing protein [Thiohalocapsa sp.]MCG6942216.1 prepilin-type N-terminal cleavage/methylation domain-containing protein [Thiohalocapsa sp.]
MRRYRRQRGFSLVELMIVVAIIGVLATVASIGYAQFVRRAESMDGYAQFGALKARIAEFYATAGVLPANFSELGLPGASGTAYDGDSGSYQEVFGLESDIWTDVEYQPKLPYGYVLVLRSKTPVDIGLHFQIKPAGGGIRVRCIVNEEAERMPYVPAQCRAGNVDDWSW